MRNYEGMFIIRPDLEKERKEGVFKKIEEVFLKYGGKISSRDIWAEERRLVYPLKSRGATKEKFDHALYLLLNFSIPQENLEKLNFELNLVEEILRWLIVRRK